MPLITHSYSFWCIKCSRQGQHSLSDEEFHNGMVINDVTRDFMFGASLDFSGLRNEDACDDFIRSGRANAINGDLCDHCFVDLLRWFRNE